MHIRDYEKCLDDTFKITVFQKLILYKIAITPYLTLYKTVVSFIYIIYIIYYIYNICNCFKI